MKSELKIYIQNMLKTVIRYQNTINIIKRNKNHNKLNLITLLNLNSRIRIKKIKTKR